MKTCQSCKLEIHDKASICPHCHQPVIGVGYLILVGLGLAGCGIWFVWIPLIGFPMVGFGLLLFVIGVLMLIVKIVKGIAGAFKKK